MRGVQPSHMATAVSCTIGPIIEELKFPIRPVRMPGQRFEPSGGYRFWRRVTGAPPPVGECAFDISSHWPHSTPSPLIRGWQGVTSRTHGRASASQRSRPSRRSAHANRPCRRERQLRAYRRRSAEGAPVLWRPRHSTGGTGLAVAISTDAFASDDRCRSPGFGARTGDCEPNLQFTGLRRPRTRGDGPGLWRIRFAVDRRWAGLTGQSLASGRAPGGALPMAKRPSMCATRSVRAASRSSMRTIRSSMRTIRSSSRPMSARSQPNSVSNRAASTSSCPQSFRNRTLAV